MKKLNNPINTLSVLLNQQRIGTINRVMGDKYLFSFEQDYIDNKNRPTLSLSFKGLTQDLITTTRVTTARLSPFFSNVLPEGHMRTYLAQKAGVKPEREFFMLAALGEDLPGAITVIPEHQTHEYTDQERVNKSRQAASFLKFSLAGIQLKFSAIMQSSGGLTIPADGKNGSWIIKLPSMRYAAVPENEFVMLSLARAIGIQVPEIKLADVKDIAGLPQEMASMQGNALVVKRFDRNHDQRIHMEDFAQVFGLYPEKKYDRRSYANIAAVLWAETNAQDTYEFFRRVIFSILIGNADMHLKNWSLLYPDGKKPMLAPAYDFVATLPYLPDDKLALSLGGSKNFSIISDDQLRRFADTANMPVSPLAEILQDTIERTKTAWHSLPEKDLLPPDILKVIQQQIHKF